MCCPASDGASAVLITTADRARRYGAGRAMRIAGMACGSPLADDLVGGPGADIGGDFKAGNLTRRLALRLFEDAGIGAADVDVAQVHDPFAMALLAVLESLGVCAEGEAGRFVLEGHTGPAGRLPTNTDGGLLCKGHPMGATGVGQVNEIVRQLRGEAGPRQAAGRPRTGLTHSSGAGLINMHLFTV